MEPRDYIGITLVAVGTSMIPIGWMFSPTVTLIGFVTFILGIAIFFTQRVIKKMEDKEFERDSGRGGYAVPTDVHDHSGWGSGGRSKGWGDSGDTGGDGGGD